MNVVDSSGWLEYFADGRNADFIAPAIEAVSELVVHGLSLYEVFKRVSQQRGEGAATMMQGGVTGGAGMAYDSQRTVSGRKSASSGTGRSYASRRWLL